MHAMEHTTAVHRGDLGFVSQRGRLFYAKVVGLPPTPGWDSSRWTGRSARARSSRPRSSIIGRAAAPVIAAGGRAALARGPLARGRPGAGAGSAVARWSILRSVEGQRHAA